MKTALGGMLGIALLIMGACMWLESGKDGVARKSLSAVSVMCLVIGYALYSWSAWTDASSPPQRSGEWLMGAGWFVALSFFGATGAYFYEKRRKRLKNT